MARPPGRHREVPAEADRPGRVSPPPERVGGAPPPYRHDAEPRHVDVPGVVLLGRRGAHPGPGPTGDRLPPPGDVTGKSAGGEPGGTPSPNPALWAPGPPPAPQQP